MGKNTKLKHSILNVKCAAVLAKRWQSAAHCSTDSVAWRMESRRRSCLLFKSPLQRFALAAPIPPSPPPLTVVIAPAPIVICITKPTAGDPCDRNLLSGFEAEGANWNLACLLLATLVIAVC